MTAIKKLLITTCALLSIITVLVFFMGISSPERKEIASNGQLRVINSPSKPAMMLSATNSPDARLSSLPVHDAAQFTSFEDAISSVGKRESILLITKRLNINKNLVVPPNIHLRFQESGLLLINPWISITINGTLEAGLFQIFGGSGLVNFTSDSLKDIYPQWWGAKGDGVANDTRAVQESINAIARAKKGSVVIPTGTYLVDTITLDSNVNLVGKGGNSIIKHNKFGYRFCFSINPNSEGTPNPGDNKHDIVISNIRFKGSVEVDGFSEGIHLMNINAATNVLISKCSFVGWRGDAIYLGSSNIAKTERHNRNITISECSFDGINKDNRNAISIIDGNNIVITKCSFANCTRKNMPGAIDIEPDIENTFAIIQNITISGNNFKNIGGFGGVIGLALLLSQTEYRNPPANLTIKNNSIDLTGNSQETDGIFLYQIQTVTDTTPSNNITVSGNTILNSRRPFKLSGMKGVVFKGNAFKRSTNAGLVASTMPISSAAKEKCQHIEFINNTFSELGSSDGVGIAVLNDVDHLDLIGNTFDNIGLPNGTSGKAISFMKGRAEWIRMENNRFSGVRTKVAVWIEPQARTNPVHNTILNNTFDNDQKMLLPYSHAD